MMRDTRKKDIAMHPVAIFLYSYLVKISPRIIFIHHFAELLITFFGVIINGRRRFFVEKFSCLT